MRPQEGACISGWKPLQLIRWKRMPRRASMQNNLAVSFYDAPWMPVLHEDARQHWKVSVALLSEGWPGELITCRGGPDAACDSMGVARFE
jgi:hypothetical protein